MLCEPRSRRSHLGDLISEVSSRRVLGLRVLPHGRRSVGRRIGGPNPSACARAKRSLLRAACLQGRRQRGRACRVLVMPAAFSRVATCHIRKGVTHGGYMVMPAALSRMATGQREGSGKVQGRFRAALSRMATGQRGAGFAREGRNSLGLDLPHTGRLGEIER